MIENTIKKVLILIVGNAGSGKTYLTQYIKKYYNYPYVVSYTTRPKRDDEIDLCDHIFVNNFDKENSENILAYTKYGNYEYWTTIDQIYNIKSPIIMYTIDEKGINYFLKKHSDKFIIYTIYINRDQINKIGINEKRLNRDNTRSSCILKNYDYTIENNSTIEDFEKNISSTIENIISRVKDFYLN